MHFIIYLVINREKAVKSSVRRHEYQQQQQQQRLIPLGGVGYMDQLPP